MNLYYINEQLIKKIKSYVFDEEDIKNFIECFLAHLKVSSFLIDIIFVNKKDNNLARYDFETKILNINYDELIKDAYSGYADSNDDDLILFTNIMIIFTLVHEITHIYQMAHLNDIGTLPRIIKNEFGLFRILSIKDYNKYWSFFTCEREALFNSYEYVLFLLKHVVNHERMYDYFFSNLVDNLLSSYKRKRKDIISPLQVINQKFMKRVLPQTTNFDIYETLKYGFQISKCEYDEYIKNIKTIVTKKLLAR